MRLFIAIIAFVAASCATVQPQPTQPGTCETYCAHAIDLGCSFARPTPAGVPCVVVCQNAQGIDPWGLACMSTAPTCEEIDKCPVPKK